MDANNASRTMFFNIHAGKDQGHHPADAGLGLEVGYTPTLVELICLEGADEPTYLKAERHLDADRRHCGFGAPNSKMQLEGLE